MLLLFCLQAFVEEGARAPAPCKAPRFLTASTTGAFVAVGEEGAVHFLDGTTLKPLLKVSVEATAVGFDETDATATILGETWIRYETRAWTEKDRGQLPDAAFRKGVAGQALAASDGDVWYRSKGSELSRARLDDGQAWVLTKNRSAGFEEVARPLAVAGPVVVVDAGGMGAIVIRGNEYGLAGSPLPLAAAVVGGRVVVVRKGGESLYDPVTWKILWTREAENAAAAFDVRRGRVFCAGPDAVRVWSAATPEAGGTFGGGYRALAIDGASRSLYALDGGTLTALRLKD
ncbi:MAG TPA: hypothetical protein VF950_11945 [Planctomycetota bacterium]